MKAYGRFSIFQLIFCLALTWIPILFCKKTRSEQILIGTSSALQEILEVLGSWKFLKHCRYWRASMRIVPAGERTPHREESLFSGTPSAGREQNSELARASNLTRSHEVSWLSHKFEQIYSKTVVDFSDNWCTTDDQLENPPRLGLECTCERRDLFPPRNLASRISHVAAPLPWLRLWSVCEAFVKCFWRDIRDMSPFP